MLKSIIVASGLLAGAGLLTSAASASELGTGLAPEAAAMVQPAHFGWGGYGGWGRGYGGWGRGYGSGYGGHHCYRPRWGGGWGYGRGYF